MRSFKKPIWIDDPYSDDIKVDDIFIDSTGYISSTYAVDGFFNILLKAATTQIFGDPFTLEQGNPIDLWSIPEVDPDTAEVIYNGITAEELDMMFIDRSGDKLLRNRIIEQILYKYRNMTAGSGYLYPMPAQAEYVVKPITKMFSHKWIELWNSMFYDFDPIENYNMVEQLQDSEKIFTHGKTETLTNNLQHAKTGTETDTPNVTATETDQKWGFNSDNGVNSDKRTTQQTGTDTRTYNTQDADTGTATNAASGQDTETHEYTLTRKGNIGVTTSQQMIEQQRRLLMFDYFNEIVFPDIDKIITLSVY